MKKLSLLTISIFLLLYFNAYSQTFKSFQTRYNFGVSLEFLGTSPLGSANIEFMALKRPKSFVNIQAGIGLISYANDTWSFPQVVTYNYWLNQRNNTRRKDCNPEKKERRAEYFLEAGIGSLIVPELLHGEQRHFLIAVTGLRTHFPLSRKSVLFAKLRFIPYTKYIYQQEFGMALGVSL
ncbi:hypothetical protein [Emticicia sp. C21]|uniref:hypothetical protein n=1 Tax=Emticicia sp. C21 TaxID=2302915 RepID=UPI000E356B42|nr:hypothetical protein [Emticicia sp. C21]RFS14197.1 hypothetical protein D0T08_21900 [Emticicia sp. C21]